MCLEFFLDAVGQFTYWSQRAGGRPVNCGLRLDYFICSEKLFADAGAGAGTGTASADGAGDGSSTALDSSLRTPPSVFDCYSLPTETAACSDHCPIVLVIKF